LQGILGKPVFRVTGTVEDESDRNLHSCAERAAFSYARLATSDSRSLQAFQAAGFQVVDTTITLETSGLPPSDGDDARRVRFARAVDADAVEQLSREGFAYSRFHLDPRIDRTVADEIKAQWAANFFRGARGDHMVVGGHDGPASGFLQLLSGADGVLTIDLIAVAASHRRKGLAAAMIRFAAHRCPGTVRLRVGTQAANIESLRLYQRLGFVITDTAHVLHCHGPVAVRR